MSLVGPIVVLSAAVVAFAIAFWIWRNAARVHLIAEPNVRSSHLVPTATGGGLGIVAGGTLGAAALLWIMPGSAFVVALLALTIAAVGFIDDRQHVPALVRLVIQFTLAAVLVWTQEPRLMPDVMNIPLPALALAPLMVLVVTYWINTFNFMDGIDGLAASQAVFMLGAAVWLALDAGAPNDPLLWWLAAVAAGGLGFLTLNWPPARIFMGDAGSTYLGFMTAFAGLSTIAAGWLNVWQWLLLGALFVSDATVTLLRRVLRGEPIFKPHRLHAYQHLSRRWRGHLPVTSLYLIANIVIVLPLAWGAGALPGFGPTATLAAYAVLFLGMALARAGAKESAAA
jgi:Fuc2NAc and GlcNAc transferase